MATEPTTLKTALAVAAVAALGPLAGEYALILIGAFGGALLSLQRSEPMPKWWQPLSHVGTGVLAGMLFTSAGSSALSHILPDSWGISTDMLWLPLSAAVARYWRDADKLLPDYLRDKLKAKGDA